MRTKMTECCTRRFLRHIAKYSRGRDGRKRRQNLQIQQMIVAEYANIFLTLNMELENRSIIFLSPVSPAPAGGTAALIYRETCIKRTASGNAIQGVRLIQVSIGNVI